MRKRAETGDSLIEILIAVVIMGLVVGAFFSAVATTSTATTSHRTLVKVDTALRDSAELTKNAVLHDCGANPLGNYVVNYSTIPHDTDITMPADVNQSCPPLPPAVGNQTPVVTITVTTASGVTKSLDVMVRTP